MRFAAGIGFSAAARTAPRRSRRDRKSPGLPRSRSAGVVRIVPLRRNERIDAGNLAGPTPDRARSRDVRREKPRPAARLRPGRASSWKRRCGRPASPCVDGARQQARLQVGELGDVVRRLRPGNVRMAAHRAGRRAGRVEQHGVEQRRPARISARRLRPMLAGRPQPLEVLAEPLQPVSSTNRGR